jgi:hypothetical protein
VLFCGFRGLFIYNANKGLESHDLFPAVCAEVRKAVLEDDDEAKSGADKEQHPEDGPNKIH